MSPRLPLSRPWFNEDELSELASTLQTGWVSRGPKCAEFEDAITAYLGGGHAVTMSNCTAALHVALVCLGIGKGDEVIVPDFTFPATALAVLYTGARPVFVDVDIQDYCIDPKAARSAITEKTRAIIPVHLFGQPADMDSVMKLAEEYKLFVVEDAACAMGAAMADGRKAGTIGDFGCFSLHGRKVITTGEGGILYTRDVHMANRARMLSQFGLPGPGERAALEEADEILAFQFTELAWNYKMSDLQAAVGLAQLRKLEKIIEMKTTFARTWDRIVQDIPGMIPPARHVGDRHAWQSYVGWFEDQEARRNAILRFKTSGFEVNIGTYSCIEQPFFAPLARAECPHSRHLFYHSLAIPMPAGMDIMIKEETDGSV